MTTAAPPGPPLAVVDEGAQALLGEHSLIALEEEVRLQWRGQLSPTLRGEGLRAHGEVIRSRTDRAIDSWPVGEAFALHPRLRRLTLEIIADVALGPEDGPRREELIREVGALVCREGSRPRVEELLAAETPAFDLGDQALTLLVAGSETTATATAWAFELVLRHPETLERMDDERYVAAVIREVLRLRSPVTHVWRRVRDEPYSVAGFELRPGTEIRVSIASGGDREFRPERFLGIDGDTSLTFGSGSHRCLGASFATFEMEIVLRRVVERLRLRLADRRPERRRLDTFMDVPARGVRVIVEPRC